MTGPSHPPIEPAKTSEPPRPGGRKVPALRITGARIPFGGDPAPGAPGLIGIDLEVQAGERLVLVGASGEGKTTLLRAVAGIAPLAGGRIEVGGADVTREPPERRRAVYLHQAPVLFPHLSVEDNVAFPLRIRGVGREETRERVHEVLRSVQLDGLGSRGPAALSGGQRHRVALARAVVARPTLLLLDEPLSSLDPRLRHEVRDAIVRLQERYRPGIVLVTHDLEEAGMLGHRVGIVIDGGIAQLGSPAELFRTPATLAVARFLGYRNEVVVRHSRGSWVSPELGGAELRPEDWEDVGGDAGGDSGGDAGGDAERAAAGDGVAVFPPGSLRIVPDAGSQSRAGRVVRVTGRVLSVGYPGPRPVAHVEVGDEAEGGDRKTVFEVMLEGAPPAAGDDVTVEIDVERVVIYPGG